MQQKDGTSHPRSPEEKNMTNTIVSLTIAAMLMGSAVAGVGVASSVTSPVASSDDSIVLIVPISGGLKRATSPVVRITR
jgi:hypothetical protein